MAEYYTQMASLASLRKRLYDLQAEHGRLLEVAFDRAPLWRGLVHETRRRCGKPNCRCARGELHVSTVLADRSTGEQRNLALDDETLATFRELTEAYRKVRRHRARIVAVQREILDVFDALETARREEGHRRYASRLSPRS
jgi:hypothetical protein